MTGVPADPRGPPSLLARQVIRGDRRRADVPSGPPLAPMEAKLWEASDVQALVCTAAPLGVKH